MDWHVTLICEDDDLPAKPATTTWSAKIGGAEVFLQTEDQSTYILMNTKYRLSNNSERPLEIIEEQTGSYVGEDGIVRFVDRYGRC